VHSVRLRERSTDFNRNSLIQQRERDRNTETERGTERIFHDLSKRSKFTASKFKGNRTTPLRSQRMNNEIRRALILPRQGRGFHSYMPREISLSLSSFNSRLSARRSSVLDVFIISGRLKNFLSTAFSTSNNCKNIFNFQSRKQESIRSRACLGCDKQRFQSDVNLHI